MSGCLAGLGLSPRHPQTVFWPTESAINPRTSHRACLRCCGRVIEVQAETPGAGRAGPPFGAFQGCSRRNWVQECGWCHGGRPDPHVAWPEGRPAPRQSLSVEEGVYIVQRAAGSTHRSQIGPLRRNYDWAQGAGCGDDASSKAGGLWCEGKRRETRGDRRQRGGGQRKTIKQIGIQRQKWLEVSRGAVAKGKQQRSIRRSQDCWHLLRRATAEKRRRKRRMQRIEAALPWCA